MTTTPAIDLMLEHRSIRSYTDEPVPPEHVEAAVRAGQMASTSSAVQAACVIRVSDPGARAELADLAGPQQKIVLAPEFFVICGDTRRHRLVARRHNTEYRATLEAFMVAIVDATLFAQNMVLAFESLGYGCCYIGGLRNDLDRVDRVLALPEGVYPLYGLCVGRPDEKPGPRPRLPVHAVLFDDRYPGDEAMLGLIDRYDGRYAEYLTQRGAEPTPWSERMASMHSAPRRTDLAHYYRSKGASLD